MKKIPITFVLLLSLIITARAQNPTPSPTPQQVNADGTATAERVTVTGGGIGKSASDSAEPVTILSENTLKEKTEPTLGDTLATQPGISASGFTAGASRPIIRGLSENRVRVLNNTTEVFDVSNLSPDHTPSVSPLLIQSIEVIRGPATILFGSGAIGGVVNVVDGRIPAEKPPTRYSGEVDGRFNSADLERSGAFALNVAATDHLILHIDGSLIRTDDRRIPGYALDERIRALLTPMQRHSDDFGGNPHGTVPNTGIETKDYAVGGSYVWDKGYFGASFNQFFSYYGVPDDPEVDDPMVPPARVHLNVEKWQVNVRSSVVDPLPWFSTANLKFVYTDYMHDELDGKQVGATFLTNGVDSRLEFVHKPIGLFEGSLGTQIFWKDLSVIGEEAFLQPSHTTQAAGFVFEEVEMQPFRFQFGARIEHQSVSIDSTDPTLTSITSPGQDDQEFWPFSIAAGAIYDFMPDWQLTLNATRSQRAPTAEELFARGAHDATFQFIIGDPALDLETVYGVDLALKKTAGPIHGSLSGFYYYYDGFIDFAPTNDFEDGLRVFLYTPKIAHFIGGEAQVDFHLLPLSVGKRVEQSDSKSVKSMITGQSEETQKNPNDLFLRVQLDYVHAGDAGGEPLPRITPLRFIASLNYEGEHWSAAIEGLRVNEQDRVSEFETTTPGYTFLNMSVGYKFQWNKTYNFVYLRGTNLTDEEARNHLSFLKEVMPLPGRSVTVGLRTSF